MWFSAIFQRKKCDTGPNQLQDTIVFVLTITVHKYCPATNWDSNVVPKLAAGVVCRPLRMPTSKYEPPQNSALNNNRSVQCQQRFKKPPTQRPQWHLTISWAMTEIAAGPTAASGAYLSSGFGNLEALKALRQRPWKPIHLAAVPFARPWPAPSTNATHYWR